MTPYRRLTTAVAQRLFRARVLDRTFTVVSNNCWGAHLYPRLGVEYRTPFVGLFLYPDCYLRLLGRLRWYLGQSLEFRPRSRYPDVPAGPAYPVGCLGGDVEVHFLHYRSADDRLFVKFCDRSGCTPEHLAAFDRLPFRNKVCFVSVPAPGVRSAVLVPPDATGTVPDGGRLTHVSLAYFDAAGWLRGGSTRPFRWAALRAA